MSGAAAALSPLAVGVGQSAAPACILVAPILLAAWAHSARCLVPRHLIAAAIAAALPRVQTFAWSRSAGEAGVGWVFGARFVPAAESSWFLQGSWLLALVAAREIS